MCEIISSGILALYYLDALCLQLTSVNGSLAPRYFTYPASRDVYRKLNVTASSTTTKTVSTLTTTTTSSTKSTTVLDAWHFDVLDFVYR